MIIIQNSLPRYIFMVFFYVKLFLNEKLSLLQIFGVIFIISGAILAESYKYIEEKISEIKSDNELSV